MLESGESKITYFDGALVHTLCGIIKDWNHDEYIEVTRRDKTVTIFKRWIVTITDEEN